ncbi:hypothetical protein BDP27DRAFT_1374301 [Rhodocollybia butyracea]|uniref:Uncharacterized protein n=1 Tax=Rhodocollybia butyracea TaxID=206335 RepID=A0A9P5TWM6_9AGAR|nr:hypothetical protein BDP27DRAFT_1374301 [Rhodocollybia butyracea]
MREALQQKLQKHEATIQAMRDALHWQAQQGKADLETEVVNLHNRHNTWSPRGKVTSSWSPASQDHDMDADDKSSGPSFASNSKVDSIQAIIKQAVAEFVAHQATHPDNSSYSSKGKKNASSLKVGSPAYCRKPKLKALATLSKEEEQQWRNLICSCFCSLTHAKGVNAFQSGYLLYFGDGHRHARWNETVVNNMVSYIASQQIKRKVEGVFSSEAIKAYVWELIQQAHKVKLFEEAHEADGGSKDDLCPASDQRKWEKVEFTLRELGTQGQSSKESDEEAVEHQLNVTVPFFRRRILGPIFNELDEKTKELVKQKAKQTETVSSTNPYTSLELIWPMIFGDSHYISVAQRFMTSILLLLRLNSAPKWNSLYFWHVGYGWGSWQMCYALLPQYCHISKNVYAQEAAFRHFPALSSAGSRWNRLYGA